MSVIADIEKLSVFLNLNELRREKDNLLIHTDQVNQNQTQTTEAFSKKWSEYDYNSPDFERSCRRQREWYLELYGFHSELDLSNYLSSCTYILDAGTGTGHKAAWFAELNTDAIVIAVDISDSIYTASEHYRHLENLIFIKSDISHMPFINSSRFDYISCDQVIHHTTEPRQTFSELVRLTSIGADLSTYVYRRKALPRELLDDHFREYSKTLTHEQRLELSKSLMHLGRILSEINYKADFPSIQSMSIQGGEMSLQRYIYWNFIKCFWNEDLGEHISTMANYDWYAPSQAYRYTKEEFKSWIREESLQEVYFHEENACFSGRFKRTK